MTNPAIRTLVVEDDPIAARAHAHHVAGMRGFEVVGAVQTGAEVEAFIRSAPVDLVLLDLFLPDMTGLEVLRRLRGAGSAADVFVVSSARDAEAVRSAVAQGAVQYLIKPFTAAVLRERLAAYQAFRQQVSMSGQVQQADVDRAFASLRSTSPGLPKGLTAQTMELVRSTLQESADCSAQELADALGISRITAGRYLGHLVESGAARRGHRYGGVGRPELRYRWIGD